jgi:drug/metabolite transporter (DMT)-like permease
MVDTHRAADIAIATAVVNARIAAATRGTPVDSTSIMQRRTETGLIAALAAVLIWGLVPVATRFFVLKLDALSFNIVRYLFAGAGALPLFWMGKPWRWPAAERWQLGLCAVLAVPGYNIPVALAARSISAGRIGLSIATEPIFIILFGAWLYRLRIHWQVAVGGAIALIGVGLTAIAAGATQISDWPDTLLALGGAISWSIYTVLVANLARRHGVLPVTGGVLTLGSLALIGMTLPFIPAALFPAPLVTLEIGALGIVSSLLGFLLWNYAATTLASDRLGMLLYFLPVISVLAAAVLLGEGITLALLFGGALTITGVAIGERRKAPDPRTS